MSNLFNFVIVAGAWNYGVLVRHYHHRMLNNVVILIGKWARSLVGCAFLTYFNPESAATAQSVLHEKQTLPGVSK